MTDTETNESGLQSRNRLVAFVDILGASQAALSGKSSVLVDDIFRLGRTMEWKHEFHSIGSAGETKTQTFKPGIAQFSDCLLLWSDPLDGLEAAQFERTAGSFLENLCKELGSLLLGAVPFRAGVSEGPVFIYPELNIYAGRPIVEAANLESCQEWLGAAMLFADHSDRLIQRHDQLYGSGQYPMFSHFVVTDVSVPLKEDTRKHLSEHTVMALNWALSAQEPLGPTYESLKTALQALQAKAGTCAKKKYELAMQFLAAVEQSDAKQREGRITS
jgi:hypothetical protein